jgi:hypothetical protein
MIDFDIDDELIRNIPGMPGVALEPTHVNDLPAKEASLIRRTVAQMSHIATPLPHPTDASLNGRVSVGAFEQPSDAEKVMDITLNSPFPNLAWEAIKVGLAKERQVDEQLRKDVRTCEAYQENIDLLLKLSRALSSHKEDTEMSEEIKALLNQLKDKEINLWKEEEENQTLTKERISTYKHEIDNTVQNLKGKTHNLFTTSVGPKTEAMKAILEALKEIHRSQARVINKANQLPGRG